MDGTTLINRKSVAVLSLFILIPDQHVWSGFRVLPPFVPQDEVRSAGCDCEGHKGDGDADHLGDADDAGAEGDVDLKKKLWPGLLNM